MYIHKEGYKIIFTAFIILAVLSVINWLTNPLLYLEILIYIGLAGWFIWTISFFRVPRRIVNFDSNAIISSADGKVVAIEEVNEPEYFNDKRIVVSVFMSPFNVHVNWYPVSGKVSYVEYHKGKHLAAYNPKSSLDNERNTVVVKASNGEEVLVRQIAGVMARRIVSYVKKYHLAKQGEEFGIIRFGSRVDFFLPTDVKVQVKIGDKVTGKKTVIANFK